MPPPVLSPGAGFGGPTSPSPAGPIGSGAGSDARVVCRWIDLLFQTRDGGFTMVVPAWHIAGMDYAEVFLDGGTKLTINAVAIHPTNGYEGFVFSVPSGLADGLHEIRLFSYPLKGYPRSLSGPHDTSDAAQVAGEHSFFFYTNENNTLRSQQVWIDIAGQGSDITGDGSFGSPKRTAGEALLRAVALLGSYGDTDEIRITMKSAGSYGTPNCFVQRDNGRPLIYEGNPGLAKTECVIDTNDDSPPRGFQCQHVHLLNCTVRGGAQFLNDGNDCHVTTEDCIIRGTDYSSFVSPFLRSAWSLGIQHLRPTFHDMNTACIEASLVVAYEIFNIGEDFLRDNRGFMVDGYCHDGRQPVPNHSNLIQHAAGQLKNVAYYGLRSRDIGIPTENPDGLLIRNLFAVSAHEDIAFVNCEIVAGGNSQVLHSVNHLLIWYMTNAKNIPTDTGGGVVISDDPPDSPVTTLHNLSIRNSSIRSLGIAVLPRGTEPVLNGAAGMVPNGTETWADNNEFGDLAAGPNVTTGHTEAQMYANPAANNRLPKAAGPLVGRVATPLVGVDANWSPRVNNGAIGAYEEDSVPTNPPVLTDITRNIQIGVAFHATVPNSGDPVDSVAVVDPTHVPAWLTVAVVGGVVDLSGTPT